MHVCITREVFSRGMPYFLFYMWIVLMIFIINSCELGYSTLFVFVFTWIHTCPFTLWCVRVCACQRASMVFMYTLLIGQNFCTIALLPFCPCIFFFFLFCTSLFHSHTFDHWFPVLIFHFYLLHSVSLALPRVLSLLTHRRNKSAWFSFRNVPRCSVSVCQWVGLWCVSGCLCVHMCALVCACIM